MLFDPTIPATPPATPTVGPSAPGIPDHGVTGIVDHLLSPAAVLIVLLLAATIDVMRVGPEWLRDRVAFIGALAGIYEGFQGSVVERYTVDLIAKLLRAGLSMTGDAYIAKAAEGVNVLIGAGVTVLGVYVAGVLMPVKWSNRVGGFAQLSFRKRVGGGGAATVAAGTGEKGKFNVRLWTCAAVLGLCADLPQGPVGDVLRTVLVAIDGVVAVVPTFFGV